MAHPQVSFMFGLQFAGSYLPWVLCAFTVVMGGSPVMVQNAQILNSTPPLQLVAIPTLPCHQDLVGIAAGHVYYFLTVAYPQQGGQRLLHTPEFIKNLFNQVLFYTHYNPSLHSYHFRSLLLSSSV